MLGPTVVYDATSNATAVDEDAVRVPLGPAVEDGVGEFNGANTIVDLPSNGPSIPSFTREDNAVVGPIPGDVNPESQRCGGINEDLAIGGHRAINVGDKEELHKALAGELA